MAIAFATGLLSAMNKAWAYFKIDNGEANTIIVDWVSSTRNNIRARNPP